MHKLKLDLVVSYKKCLPLLLIIIIDHLFLSGKLFSIFFGLNGIVFDISGV